ncbi:MAG: FixH family protein [Tabrizicola sp.]|jgi:nitrogen fixation protein FixH|uniref:FixH family protein n=1 Tax=Tabrizicola sp. TaxID=2005166 RepID=UPI001B62ACA4|nr:FixH family protein [Tabrizicola sp.]MCC6520042.1 FixH family protein [Tabrizicola sp.]
MAELTGKHVFAITASAFAVIIGVNILLAVKAVSTFPGLEVDNSYVASQGFNARKAAQETLGWSMTPGYEQGRMTLAFHGADGQPVQVQDLQVLVGRTTEAKDDAFPVFVQDGAVYAAEVPLHKGKWMVKVTARSPDGTLFEQRSEIYVKG